MTKTDNFKQTKLGEEALLDNELMDLTTSELIKLQVKALGAFMNSKVWLRPIYRCLKKLIWNILGPSNVKKGPFFSSNRNLSYTKWIEEFDQLNSLERSKYAEEIKEFPFKPLISVVMPVYNPPIHFLEAAIESVRNQLYTNWELCIADDASTDKRVLDILKQYAANDKRIKVIFRKSNGHISAASNSALKLATGDYVALMDNDDLLPEHALFWVAKTVIDHPKAVLIYSDEDKIDTNGNRFDPHFKSEWNYNLFLSQNMISHLGVYKTELIKNLGGFRDRYNGSQDYDLALRVIEKIEPDQIVHIPRVLYHWRSHVNSAAQKVGNKKYALSAAKEALNDHLKRKGVDGSVEILPHGYYRVRYNLPQELPLVSLIIPTRNKFSLISKAIDSILQKTKYKNYEIIIIDNLTNEENALLYLEKVSKDPRVRIIKDDETPFNYSSLNNRAVNNAKGDFIVLLNNDIEVITPEWLDEMIGLAIQKDVGIVGAKLWYPNNRVQHAGVILGLGGVAGHIFNGLPKHSIGYFGRSELVQELSAVTGACLLVKKSVYKDVGGLDDLNLKVAFNDIDFCLRVGEAGYRIVWTPYAELYHHESATRGMENTPEKIKRFWNEVHYMKKRWGNKLLNDPYYNPNLSLDIDFVDVQLAWPPRNLN